VACSSLWDHSGFEHWPEGGSPRSGMFFLQRCALVLLSLGVRRVFGQAPKHHREPGPQHAFRPGNSSRANSRIVLYGAQARHNFGDNLMAEVIREVLVRWCGYAEHEILFADIVGQDMRLFGGREVHSIASIANTITQQRVDVISLGGEVLGCTGEFAVKMIVSTWGTRAAKLELGRDDARHVAVRRADGAYIARKAWFAKPGVFIVNSVGGGGQATEEMQSLLRDDSGFMAFRDTVPPGLPHGTLAPDSVVLLRKLFSHRIALAGDALGSKQYVAVQFHQHATPERRELLAAQIATIARHDHLDVVLFRAGAAWDHDTLESLEHVAGLITDFEPTIVVQLFQDLNIWSIVAVVARAQLVVATSLHVRIVAFAFCVPRLYNTVFEVSGKFLAFVQLWDNASPEFAVQSKRPLENLAEDWLRIAPDTMVLFRDSTRADEVVDVYERKSFSEWTKLLSQAHDRPSCTVPPTNSDN